MAISPRWPHLADRRLHKAAPGKFPVSRMGMFDPSPNPLYLNTAARRNDVRIDQDRSTSRLDLGMYEDIPPPAERRSVVESQSRRPTRLRLGPCARWKSAPQKTSSAAEGVCPQHRASPPSTWQPMRSSEAPRPKDASSPKPAPLQSLVVIDEPRGPLMMVGSPNECGGSIALLAQIGARRSHPPDSRSTTASPRFDVITNPAHLPHQWLTFPSS